jgi:hypothetical protein
MFKLTHLTIALAAALLFILPNAPAQAQATRTWISGVGDDVNPCSRTAPCKTWAGAISKTAAGGEIDALDPGGFGTLTIVKAITIDGGGGIVASISSAGTNGINVNAGVNDVVIIRNLRINGSSQSTVPGTNGINFIAGAMLSIENCGLLNFSQAAINVTTAGTSTLSVTNTNITNAANGINLTPISGTLHGIIDHTTIQTTSSNGIKASGSAFVTVTNSNIVGSAGTGVNAGAAGTSLNVDSSSVSNNNTGFATTGGSIRISRNAIYGNNANYSIAGGTIATSGNNVASANGATVPNGTVAQQ